MVVQLLRKDFLITKSKYIIVLIILVGLQVISATEMMANFQGVVFLYSVVFCTLLVLNSISQYEAVYPKAINFLCAAPYSRSAFVISKYITMVLIFLLALVANIIITLIIRGEILMPASAILLVLAINTIIFGIYFPLEFKFGYDKTKFFFMIMILVVAFLPAIFSNLIVVIDFGAIEQFITKIVTLPAYLQCIALAVIIVAVFIISMVKSIKIFENKDL